MSEHQPQPRSPRISLDLPLASAEARAPNLQPVPRQYPGSEKFCGFRAPTRIWRTENPEGTFSNDYRKLRVPNSVRSRFAKHPVKMLGLRLWRYSNH